MVNQNVHEGTSKFYKTRSEYFKARMGALRLCHKIRVNILVCRTKYSFHVKCQTVQTCNENRPSVAIDCTKPKGKKYIFSLMLKIRIVIVQYICNYQDCEGNC